MQFTKASALVLLADVWDDIRNLQRMSEGFGFRVAESVLSIATVRAIGT